MSKRRTRTCDQCSQPYTSRSPRFCSRSCCHAWTRKQRPLSERFWSNVKKASPDDCWPWTGNKDKNGYGIIWADGKNASINRIAWQLTYQSAPKGKFIRHHCGNVICCNPRHLFIDNPHDIFWAKVDIKNPTQCWEWTGKKNTDGYGVVRINKREERTHRISWKLSIGAIPEGKYVLHRCDNRSCTNPAHLFLGTQQDNIADMDAKGRRKSAIGANNGRSKLTEKDVLTIRSLSNKGIIGTKLAAQFGVHKSTIYEILSGTNWKHI